MKCSTGPFQWQTRSAASELNYILRPVSSLPGELSSVNDNCYVLFHQDLLVLEEQEVCDDTAFTVRFISFVKWFLWSSGVCLQRTAPFCLGSFHRHSLVWFIIVSLSGKSRYHTLQPQQCTFLCTVNTCFMFLVWLLNAFCVSFPHHMLCSLWAFPTIETTVCQ